MRVESSESLKGSVSIALSPVGALHDLGVCILLASFILLLIGFGRPRYLAGCLLFLGVLLRLDAKLLYLTSFSPEFFHRRSFWLERFSMMISGALFEAGLLWLVFCGIPVNFYAGFICMLSTLLLELTYRTKLRKELRVHPDRNSIIDGFYSSSLIGRFLLGIGLGPYLKRTFLR